MDKLQFMLMRLDTANRPFLVGEYVPHFKTNTPLDIVGIPIPHNL